MSVTERSEATPPRPAPGLPDAVALPDVVALPDAVALERRGRSWLLWSFLLCPCHLPWTLAMLGALAGGTSFGVAMRAHPWIAGTAVTVAWLAGTAYGLRLIRRAERTGGACPTRPGRRRTRRG